MVQKIYSEMHLVSCTNTHHAVTDLVNHGMIKNTKTWISWERNIIFLRNKKNLNLYFRWHILRSYSFVAEVTFKDIALAYTVENVSVEEIQAFNLPQFLVGEIIARKTQWIWNVLEVCENRKQSVSQKTYRIITTVMKSSGGVLTISSYFINSSSTLFVFCS